MSIPPAADHVDCIFLNGTVGVGKTTVAEEISRIEPSRHALIDLDQLRRLVPGDTDDPFNHELELKNLASVAQNFREAGARRFVLAGVIERREELPRYAAAVGAPALFVCRLTAPEPELHRRLRLRHAGNDDELYWHLDRVGELNGILDEDPFEDLRLDTVEVAPDELARVVREAAGWTSATSDESVKTMTVATWQVIDATMDNVRAIAIIDRPSTAARAVEIRKQGWLQLGDRWDDPDATSAVTLRDEQWALIVQSLTEAVPIYQLLGDQSSEAATSAAIAAVSGS